MMNWERTELAPPGLEGKRVARWQEGRRPSAGNGKGQQEVATAMCRKWEGPEGRGAVRNVPENAEAEAQRASAPDHSLWEAVRLRRYPPSLRTLIPEFNVHPEKSSRPLTSQHFGS